VIPLSISAVGLTSSLGVGSEQACASARAGVARVTPVDSLNAAVDPALAKETIDGVPLLVAHQVPAVATGFTGLGKLLVLARSALDEVLRKLHLTADQQARTGLCLSLSDDYFLSHFGQALDTAEPVPPPGHGPTLDARALALCGRLCREAGLGIDRPRQWVSRAGRLGMLGAFNQAASWIEAGLVDRCLIGAVDSLVEPAVLQACGKARVLKTDANPVGFMPGEAASFVVVEHAGQALAPVQVLASDYAVDESYFAPRSQPLGQGLLKVVQEVVQTVASSPPAREQGWPRLIVTDLNGTEMRAMDWGHALVRLREALGEFEPAVWLPVESFGETGAVTGLLAVCMVYEAARRGQLPDGQVLVLLSAEQGGRGSVLLETRRPAH